MAGSSDKSVKRLVRQFRLRANALAIARKLLPPIIILMIVAIIARILGQELELSNFALKSLTILAIFAWLGWAIFIFLSIGKITLFSEAQATSLIEKHSGLEAIAPLSENDAIRASGDTELWQIAQTNKNNALNKLVAPKLAKHFDYVMAIFSLLVLGAFIVNPAQNLNSIAPNFSLLIDGAPVEINTIATQPKYTNLPQIELTNNDKVFELAEGSIISIRLNGAKSAPKIQYGPVVIKMRQENANNWHASIEVRKSAQLKVRRFGTKQSWKIKVKKDFKPNIGKDLNIAASGYDKANLTLKANDDYELKSARLVLQSPNKKIQTLIEIDPKFINLGEISNLSVKTSHSALVGKRVNAFLEIVDAKGQKARSRLVKLDLPKPVFNSNFAKALQEVRLLILTETSSYKRVSPEYMWVQDISSGEKIKIMASENIRFAPPNVARAYETLAAIHSIRGDLGLSVANSFSLTHALKTLEYAKSTEEAQKSAETLWNIIETFENSQIDSRSKIANAIENLKAALKSGAEAPEIEALKSELQVAISEHLKTLSEQSGESGDMEIAENEISDQIDIQQILDNAQNDAAGGNSDEAAAKLDELNQMLSQLQPGGQGAGQSIKIDGLNQSGAPDPLAQEQQNLFEDTKNSSEGQNGSLMERQENLLSKIPEDGNSDAPADPKLNEARAAMGAALEALKAGDKQGAIAAQQAAIDALKQRSDNQLPHDSADNNKDPLGRNLLPKSGEEKPSAAANKVQKGSEDRNNKIGKNDGSQTKLPGKSDPIRAQSILDKLRERLSRQSQSEEERNYLENAIAN